MDACLGVPLRGGGGNSHSIVHMDFLHNRFH